MVVAVARLDSALRLPYRAAEEQPALAERAAARVMKMTDTLERAACLSL
jgi:hypothetical protein